jgi:hypothetical protein
MKPLLSALAAFAIGALAMRAWMSRHASHDAPESHGADATNAAPHEPAHGDAEPPGELKLPKATQEKLGLKTTVVSTVPAPEELAAFGRVLDAGPLLGLVAELQSASAAAAASELEWKRTHGLFEQDRNASARMLEQAEAARKRDLAVMASLRARMDAAGCPELLQLPDLGEVAQQLGSRQVSLVRLDLPGDRLPVSAPTTARIAAIGREDGTTGGSATLIGRAAAADPQFLGVGYLGLLPGGSLPAGTALNGWIPSGRPPAPRVRLPDSALLHKDGNTLVYVQSGPEAFQPRVVSLLRADGDGWLLESGLKTGDTVVTTGAQALLSAGSKPADAD